MKDALKNAAITIGQVVIVAVGLTALTFIICGLQSICEML